MFTTFSWKKSHRRAKHNLLWQNFYYIKPEMTLKYNWPNLVYSAKGISCTVFLKIIWGDYFSFKCEFKKVSFKGEVTTPDVWTLYPLIKCENSTWKISALPRTILSAHQRSKSKSKNFFFFRAVCCYSGNSWNQTFPSHMTTMFLLAH